jgi:electron transport complex protein RnfB
MSTDGHLAKRIDALLPQTQCTKCGFNGCLPYAQAMASGEANINRCPPGGTSGIAKLATLLGRKALPLDEACGVEAPRRVALIIEEHCIGCTLCIQACPVDAIVGVTKHMHTVVAELCTGCDLCIPPCPVDCIDMVEDMPDGVAVPAWAQHDADAARARYVARNARLVREHDANQKRLAAKAQIKLADIDAEINQQLASGNVDAETQRKRSVVAAAIARARERLQLARG